MKKEIRTLLCMVALFAGFSVCFVLGTDSAAAARTPAAANSLIILDNDNIIQSGRVLKKVKGLSYNARTNTITLKNLNKPNSILAPINIGDVRIVIKGNVRLGYIFVRNYPGTENRLSLSISGSGKLTMKDKGQDNKYKSWILVTGPAAKLTIAKKTRMSIKSSANSCMGVYRTAYRGGNASALTKISGKHSKGKFVYSVDQSGQEVCRWSKSTFEKNGKAAPKKTKKKSKKKKKSKNDPLAPARATITRTQVGAYGDRSVAVWWNQINANCTGYEMNLNPKKSFPKRGDYIMECRGQNYTQSGCTNLPKGNLYIRVRGFNNVNGKYHYGKWSAVKKVVIP